MKPLESNLSIPTTNQSIAQQDSKLTTVDNFSSSSSTSFDDKTPVFVVNSATSLPEAGACLEEESGASSDIFSQIGNLVKSNKASTNKQLPNGLTDAKTEHKLNPLPLSVGNSPIRPEKVIDASTLVSAFPLLDFMRSPTLLFPVKSDSIEVHTDCYSNSFTKGDTSLAETNSTQDNMFRGFSVTR